MQNLEDFAAQVGSTSGFSSPATEVSEMYRFSSGLD